MIDVLMLCVGSRGDVQPFVCLAQELMKQQLSVVVAAHGEYQDFVESCGCQFAQIRSSLPKALNTSESGQRLRDGASNAAFKESLGFFKPLIKASVSNRG
jgi:sterol 3beta-glucosyltransferase